MTDSWWRVADMSPLLAGAIACTVLLYLVAIGIAMVRVFRGPSAQDRVLALDFIYVLCMLIILVLGIRYRTEHYFEAALLIALFGFMSSTAFAKFLLRGEVIE